MIKEKLDRLKDMRGGNLILIAIFSSIIVAVMITGLGMAYYQTKIRDMGLVDEQTNKSYAQHYALIAGDDDDYFWDSVYKGALEKGKNQDVYVERFGENLPLDYSVRELLKMAIAARVDGIILEAGDDSETTALIDQAADAGIPVVTVLQDAPKSKRQSFIGVNHYSFGKKYGKQVLDAADESFSKVLVLLDEDGAGKNQNIILSGIREVLDGAKIATETLAIDRQSAFSSEEAIREVIVDTENMPDAIICLNTVDTVCAYQALVDLNKVGEVEIIGYYDSDIVLEAVNKGIIHSTIAINTEQMGSYCVEALVQYKKTGNVNENILVNSQLISREEGRR